MDISRCLSCCVNDLPHAITSALGQLFYYSNKNLLHNQLLHITKQRNTSIQCFLPTLEEVTQ